MVTRVDIANELAQLEAHLANRVEVWHSVIAPDGRVIKRIYSGSFTPSSLGWQPPTLSLEEELAKAKKGSDSHD